MMSKAHNFFLCKLLILIVPMEILEEEAIGDVAIEEHGLK
jgi:hypothetical protein